MLGVHPDAHVKTWQNLPPDITKTQISLHIRAAWSVFIVRINYLCIFGYQKCAQCRFWSDFMNAQVDLNLQLAHMSEGTFSDVAAHLFNSFGAKFLMTFVVCFFILTNCRLERRLYVKLKDWMSNSVDPDEMAHLGLCCLQKLLLSPVAVKELKGGTSMDTPEWNTIAMHFVV